MPPKLPDAAARERETEDRIEREALEESRATLGPIIAEPDEPKDGAVAEAEEALLARVRELKADYPHLSDEDILESLTEARAEVEERRRTAAMDRIRAAERARLRREEGLTVGVAHLDEMVKLQVELQDWQNPMTLNGQPYYNGVEYTIPRHVAHQIAETMQWGRRLQRELDGKDSLTEFYRKSTQTKFSAVRGTTRQGVPV